MQVYDIHIIYNLLIYLWLIGFCSIIPAVTRKGFGSADCDTIYTLYQSLCTQSANPNPFGGTACT